MGLYRQFGHFLIPCNLLFFMNIIAEPKTWQLCKKKILPRLANTSIKRALTTPVSLPEDLSHQSFVMLFNYALNIMEVDGDALS